MGHPVVVRIDLAAVHPPDLTVEGMGRAHRGRWLSHPAEQRPGQWPAPEVVPPIGAYRPPMTSSTSSISSAASSLPNSSTVQRSLMPPAALSIRSRGTSLPDPTRCFGSMTRCVTVFVAGVDDHADHLAARAVHATRLGSHRELGLFGHSCLPPTAIAGIPPLTVSPPGHSGYGYPDPGSILAELQADGRLTLTDHRLPRPAPCPSDAACASSGPPDRCPVRLTYDRTTGRAPGSGRAVRGDSPSAERPPPSSRSPSYDGSGR